MKNWIFAALLGLLLGCVDDHASGNCGDLSWLTNLKADITAQGYKGEVHSAQMNNEMIYIVNGCVNCADYPTILYDCRGKVICSTGGIIGNANCILPAERTLIWKNY